MLDSIKAQAEALVLSALATQGQVGRGSFFSPAAQELKDVFKSFCTVVTEWTCFVKNTAYMHHKSQSFVVNNIAMNVELYFTVGTSSIRIYTTKEVNANILNFRPRLFVPFPATKLGSRIFNVLELARCIINSGDTKAINKLKRLTTNEKLSTQDYIEQVKSLAVLFAY